MTHARAGSDGTRGDGPVVFLVDDDEAVRDAIELLLRASGLTVRAFASAERFLEFYRPQMPGCLLLDIRMPGMNGWDVWERMQQDPELAATPVVVVSGDGPDAGRARAVGMRAVLRKPVESATLLAAVAEHCGAGR